MTDNLQQNSYKQTICSIIFDIINEFIDIYDEKYNKGEISYSTKTVL